MTASRINLLQAILCSAALISGGLLYWWGARDLARLAWLGGSCPVTLSILFDIWVAVRQKKFGLDLIALIAIVGAIVLQESLTAVVIALMFTSGRALENYPEKRAREEMSALLGKAPQCANRCDGSRIVQVPFQYGRGGAMKQSGELIWVNAVDGLLTRRFNGNLRSHWR